MVLCRLCAASTMIKHENIFVKSNRNILQQIKSITGCVLKNMCNMPTAICTDCYQFLDEAVANFRKQCIRAQKYFRSNGFKTGAAIEDENKASKIYRGFLKSNEQIKMSDFPDDSDNRRNVAVEGSGEGQKENNSFGGDINIENKISTLSNDLTDDQYLEHKIDSKNKSKSTALQTYICHLCGNSFHFRHHFRIHLRRHDGDKRYECEICPDKFFTNSELKRHIRRHTGEKPFACKFCQRSFGDYSTRTKHERTHSNDRPYPCPQALCGKAFMTPYVLRNHMLIHTGERSFNCSLCNKSFQRKTHLSVHTRSLTHKINQQAAGQSAETTSSG